MLTILNNIKTSQNLIHGPTKFTILNAKTLMFLFIFPLYATTTFLFFPQHSQANSLITKEKAIKNFPPRQIIAEFQENLLETMKKTKFTPIDERFQKLKHHISRTFHIPLMAHMVVKEYWKNSGKTEKEKFVNTFLRYNAAYLASLLHSYSGQSFKFESSSLGPQGTTIIRTTLEDPDGSIVKIAYILKNFSGDWRAIDVILDNGISEMKMRQSEYHKILKKSRVKGLRELLEAKIQNLLTE